MKLFYKLIPLLRQYTPHFLKKLLPYSFKQRIKGTLGELINANIDSFVEKHQGLSDKEFIDTLYEYAFRRRGS